MFNSQLAAKDIAKSLLNIEAIKLQPEEPFTWASGWRSPIYCDNRLTLSHPDVREKIKHYFVDMIEEKFKSVGQLAGVATAGIAHGALIADKMGLPFCYVRSKAKGHGRQNQIEGKLLAGKDVVVVEDLISTGGSTISAVEVLREQGANVIGAVAIFTYGFPQAEENFAKIACPYATLSSYKELLPAAVEMKYVQQEQLEVLGQWRKSPSTWMQS